MTGDRSNEVQGVEDTAAVPKQSRKQLLKVAGVAAGAVVAGSLARSQPAEAADGDPFMLGASNTATSKTTLSTVGTISNDGALVVSAAAADYGVYGSAASYGVVGSGPGGVLGLGTVGGVFSGSSVAINLDPQPTQGAPTGEAFKGDMAVDSDGVLWLCVGAGTPGTWIRVSHGGTRLLPTPQRAYSSTDVGSGARMNQGETRTVPVVGVVSGIPANALGVVANITIHSTISGGFVTAYPAGASQPATSTINWGATGQSIANGATIALGTGGAVALFADAGVPAGSAATHVIVDITAYVL